MQQEADEAFYRRRRDEELRRAAEQHDPDMRRLHENWAMLYEKRLSPLSWFA